MTNPRHSEFDEIPALKAQIRARDEEIARLKIENQRLLDIAIKARIEQPLTIFVYDNNLLEQLQKLPKTGPQKIGDGVVGDD